MARAEGLLAWSGIICLDEELTRLGAFDGSHTVRSSLSDKRYTKIFAAVILASQSCSNLLLPSFDASVLILNEFGIYRKKICRAYTGSHFSSKVYAQPFAFFRFLSLIWRTRACDD